MKRIKDFYRKAIDNPRVTYAVLLFIALSMVLYFAD